MNISPGPKQLDGGADHLPVSDAKAYYSAIDLNVVVFSEARGKIYFRFPRTNERIFMEAIPFFNH